VQPSGEVQHVAGPEAIGILLALLDEAGLREHGRVLERVTAQHPDLPGAGEDLPGEQLHQGGLAGAVAPEQTVDPVLPEVEVDVLEGGDSAIGLGQGAGRDGGHRRASFVIISVSSSGAMPRWAASRSSGAMNSSRNASRRRRRSRSVPPSATNTPRPRRLTSTPASASRFSPFPAVAGLMRRNAASAFVDGTAAPSG